MQRPAPTARICALGAVALIFAGIAGCNSTSFSDGLDTRSTSVAPNRQIAPGQNRPRETVGNETALLSAPRENSGSAQASLQRRADPVSTRTAPVAFLPVTGAPQSTVTTLAGSMRRAAQQNAVPVVVSVNEGARYQIKGYFSALNDGDGTLLVYVWDVLDSNGTRIHRISGQERAGASSSDPWASIDDNVIERVAATTMSSLRSWMQNRSG